MVVDCPRCGAVAGERCQVVRDRVWFGRFRYVGEPIQQTHAARVRAMGDAVTLRDASRVTDGSP